ncbi:hypothetical protein TSAR_010447 [Trichomalopsis sarcophagae]|uniref:Uncharacterized protein n=1 Tax=Trichomalopsis sarcophagae TaxID=543379 RepID=A0A232EDB1_9HYME|nr:hypothetical protein TSAR_010447 [Trichomalopsis sarcophagae]
MDIEQLTTEDNVDIDSIKRILDICRQVIASSLINQVHCEIVEERKLMLDGTQSVLMVDGWKNKSRRAKGIDQQKLWQSTCSSHNANLLIKSFVDNSFTVKLQDVNINEDVFETVFYGNFETELNNTIQNLTPICKLINKCQDMSYNVADATELWLSLELPTDAFNDTVASAQAHLPDDEFSGFLHYLGKRDQTRTERIISWDIPNRPRRSFYEAHNKAMRLITWVFPSAIRANKMIADWMRQSEPASDDGPAFNDRP